MDITAKKEQLALTLLKLFIKNTKAGTSWRNREHFSDYLSESGFNGIFTGLDSHYEIDELHELIYEIWNDFD